MLSDKAYRDNSILSYRKLLDQYYHRELTDEGIGQIRGTGRGTVTGGVKTPFGGVTGTAGGEMSIGHQTTDKRKVDYNTAVAWALFVNAYEKTKEIIGGKDYYQLSGEERKRFEQVFASIYQKEAKQVYEAYRDWAKEQNPADYGATAYGHRLIKFVEKKCKFLGDKAKKIIEMADQGVSSDKMTEYVNSIVYTSGLVKPPSNSRK